MLLNSRVSTAGVDNGLARHADHGRHGPRVSGRTFSHAHTAYEETVHVAVVLVVFADDARGGPSDIADARFQPGKRCSPQTRSSSLPACYNVRVRRFLQDKRMSVMDALVHPYIDEGRLRYHSCMCKCCFTVPLTGLRHFCMDYEPVAPQTFDDKWEKKMSNVQQVKG